MMNKDYSKRNLINRFGLNLPNNIGNIVSLLISLPIFFFTDNIFIILLVMGFINSFIGLEISGSLLDKHCTNEDNEKCKKCCNWNCKRRIEDE